MAAELRNGLELDAEGAGRRPGLDVIGARPKTTGTIAMCM
jgi:hypothetical protein